MADAGDENPEDDRITAKQRRKELGLSCMLNTEVGAVLAVIRRPSSHSSQFITPQEDTVDSSILHSLKSLRALIFNPQQEWRMIDPSVYLSPFLDVTQSDDVPAVATGVALSSLLKILKIGIFDEKTPGAKDAINSVVTGIVNCRLGKTDNASEEAVLMRILHVLSNILRHSASTLLTDQAVCTIVNTCFQIVQQSANRGNLLQRNARYTMHELIQIIFARLPDLEIKDGENSESDTDDVCFSDSGYGVRCMVDIFHFLCSLLNVVEVVEADGSTSQTADEDVQIFALVLINSAIELSGDSIGSHPKLLRMIQDDLFHHLIHYGMASSQLVLAMICSTVLSIYHFLRQFIRLQLEAFFVFVLFRVASTGISTQLREVATEGMINFCRQPAFILESYVNYDCNIMCQNVFEEIGKLLCKHAFPTSSPLSSLQIQAFEGLVIIIHNIADNINMEDPNSFEPFSMEVIDYRPYWDEKPEEEEEDWVGTVRLRKIQKRKIMVAANHFNHDYKKGLDYLKYSNLVSEEAMDPKAYAFFFRFSQGLNKDAIGDYLGDPDEFNIQVLKEYANTFEFSGMILDTALRTFLETFRLPGESQKIHRIVEAFSERFYDQQSSEIFVSKDAVFVFCYSVIMLNTDQHNPQVKKRMTEEEFVRNNRGINGGNDLPRDYLSELFQSIASNEIKVLAVESNKPLKMGPNRWVELTNRSRSFSPFFMCNFNGRVGRDMFATIAGPSVATLSACFEHAEEDEFLHECVEGLFSIGRIAQYGLDDTLDELLASFCKFTTLLNPYASSEETLFNFSHDIKPRMATLAVFTMANSFGFAIRGGWRNIVDCLLKLKRLKLLPQTLLELDADSMPSADVTNGSPESGVVFPNQDPRFGGANQNTGMIGRFSHFLAVDSAEESLSLGASEFEQNLKVIKQCRIGNIFATSRNLPNVALLHLGRSLIFSAAGKGQKFSTQVEEEETVAFCWDLLNALTITNIHRFSMFWPSFHDNLVAVAQFPLFSPIPFAEKAMVSQLKVCLRLISTRQQDNLPEELIFRSITMMWKMDKEILDACTEPIFKLISKILVEFPENLQSQIGWKSVLHLLVVTGRTPETFDDGVETLISLLSNMNHLSRMNYACIVDCAFGFIGLKSCPVDKKIKILELLTDTMDLLIQWHKHGFTEPGNTFSTASNTSNSSVDDNSKALGTSNIALNLFVKLAEFLKNTSLARRDEVRNHAIRDLGKILTLAENLDFTSVSCIKCFNLVVFAMVDDLHEKVVVYSRRDNVESEVRSWEESLNLAMDVLTDAFLHFLKLIWESPGFRTFWLGVLRRMDTCMKTDLGPYGEPNLHHLVPELLRKMITKMKEDEILLPRDGDDLWEITYIQIQWIAPSLKEELFPEL